MLKLFAEKLRSEGVGDSEIIFIDCEANECFETFQTLYEFVAARTVELEKFFLLIDEIDRVAECEKAVNALFVGTPAEIYVTCSSETLPNKISALLPDNCDVLKIYPLSFAEYSKNFSAEDTLQNYLNFGGLPCALNADKKFLPTVLRCAVYEIIFDIIEKNSLQRTEFFRRTLKILAQNVGVPVSLNQLFESLKNFGYSAKTFRNYLNRGLELFKKIPRLDIKTGKILNGGEKFYCVDNGILRTLVPNIDESILMENAVYVELLRRGFSVSSGKFGTMNVTFVAECGSKKIFIQVLPTSGISARRITRPLRAVSDDVEKILITSKPEKIFGDVTNITLRDFLTGL